MTASVVTSVLISQLPSRMLLHRSAAVHRRRHEAGPPETSCGDGVLRLHRVDHPDRDERTKRKHL